MKERTANPERSVAFVLLTGDDEGVRGLLDQAIANLPAGEESALDWRFLAHPTVADATLVLQSNDPETSEIGLIVAPENPADRSGTALLETAQRHVPRARRMLLSATFNSPVAEAAVNSGLADKCFPEPREDPLGFVAAVVELLEAYEHTKEILPDRAELQREIARLRAQAARLCERRDAAADAARFACEMYRMDFAQTLDYLPGALLKRFGAEACCLHLPRGGGRGGFDERRVTCTCRPLQDMESHPAVYQALATGEPATMPIGERPENRCPAFDAVGRRFQVVIPVDMQHSHDADSEVPSLRPDRGMICLCGVPARPERDREAIHYRAALLQDVLNATLPETAARATGITAPDTDHVTGLAGRRTFEEHLRREIERARRYKTVFSVALLEVDELAGMEADGNRSAAKEVLAGIADILATQTRTVDFPARTGAVEFAILFPMTPTDGGRQAVERLRDLIARASFPEAGRPVTIAAGVAGDENGEDVSALLRAVESARVKARRAGGNCVRLCAEDDPEAVGT